VQIEKRFPFSPTFLHFFALYQNFPAWQALIAIFSNEINDLDRQIRKNGQKKIK
jgi:hypothetical protein